MLLEFRNDFIMKIDMLINLANIDNNVYNGRQRILSEDEMFLKKKNIDSGIKDLK